MLSSMPVSSGFSLLSIEARTEDELASKVLFLSLFYNGRPSNQQTQHEGSV